MQTQLGFLTILSLALWLAIDNPLAARVGDDKTDQEKLAGTWKITTMTFDGEDVPAEVAKMLSYTFTGNKATARGRLVSSGGRFLPAAGTDSYTIALGTSGKLKTIDLKPTARGRKTIPGIYELDGDTLKLCLNFAGQRPKEFSSQGGQGISLMTCAREKK
jgi:uncharacterized protein (TIGR03067 family)